jgi:adenylate cyclase
VAQANTALAEVYAIQYRNLLITVIILCAAILLLFFFSRSISRPIRRLVDSANAVRSGDFDLQLRIGNHDEIGRLAQAFTEMARGLAEREKIKDTFGKFVNKEIAELALSSDLELGGEYRQAAIFFSDIRSFTALSENLAPHAVVEFLNGYMSRMVACVDQTSGVVNKFIGDAIMAVWGVPSSAGNDTENAINCALLMRRALDEFNAGRPGSPPTRIGIGINTGEVIAGQIGSSQRMEYTCIGDAVNLASRVETLTKPFQADILISEQAHAAVAGLFRVAAMKRIKVKGKTEAQQVYAVLGRADDPNCPADMAELRRRLGLAEVALDQVDADREEEKFEIL